MKGDGEMDEDVKREGSWFCPFINGSCKGLECHLWDSDEEDCTIRVMSQSLTEMNRGIEYMKAYQRRWGRYFY